MTLTEATKGTEMRQYEQKQTANDPEAFVAKSREGYANDPRGFTFEIVSIDGETKSGRKRFTVRITIADPTYYDRQRAAR